MLWPGTSPRHSPNNAGRFPLASPLCARLRCSRYWRPGWISPPPPRVSAGRDDNAALRRPRPLHFSPRLPPLDGGRVHSGPLPDNPGPVCSGVRRGSPYFYLHSLPRGGEDACSDCNKRALLRPFFFLGDVGRNRSFARGRDGSLATAPEPGQVWRSRGTVGADSLLDRSRALTWDVFFSLSMYQFIHGDEGD